MQELYEAIHEDVAREARLAAARWHMNTDADDIEQELWLWVMERPGTQQFFKTANKAQIAAALSSRATDICSKDKVSYEHFSGQYVYTPAEVREILDVYFGSDVSEVSDEVLTLAQENLSETMIGNILGGHITPDEKIDIELGLDHLVAINPDYYKILVDAYEAGIEPEERVYKTRAVDKLTDIMNQKRSQRAAERVDGPGTKPKVTNPEY